MLNPENVRFLWGNSIKDTVESNKIHEINVL